MHLALGPLHDVIHICFYVHVCLFVCMCDQLYLVAFYMTNEEKTLRHYIKSNPNFICSFQWMIYKTMGTACGFVI